MKKYRLNTVIFEVTRDCNLDCVYCYNHWKALSDGIKYPENNSYSMAVKTLKRLFKLADLGHVTFSGGEPFLFERLHELALFCRMKKKTVTIITNGFALKDDDLTLFKDIGTGLFELPVHSFDGEIHDRMTGKNGAWKKSVETIENLGRLGIPVAAVVVLTKTNAKDMVRTLEFIKKLGVQSVLFNRYNIGGKSMANWKEIALPPAELRNVLKTVDRFAAESGMKISSGVCTPVCLADPRDYPHIAFGHCGDSPETMPLALDIFGNVRYCNHSPKVIGNLFEKSLREMFESAESREWFQAVPDGCGDCAELKRCKGGCRAASEQACGDVRKPDPYRQMA